MVLDLTVQRLFFAANQRSKRAVPGDRCRVWIRSAILSLPGREAEVHLTPIKSHWSNGGIVAYYFGSALCQ
jgi:hypothetical protein